MDDWEVFEDSCVDYLNGKFGNEKRQFIGEGKRDATKPDIEYFDDDGFRFAVEAKMQNAQCGQFVVMIEGKSFVLSTKSKFEKTLTTSKIIDFINRRFEYYRNVNSTGLEIDCDKELLFTWIEEHYKAKSTEYIISEYGGEFVIVPIDNLRAYFNVEAVLRRKKSGSGHLNAPNIDDFLNAMHNSGYPNIRRSDVYIAEDSFCITTYNIPNRSKFEGKRYTYQLTKENTKKYQIRKLSITNNPNVVFSLHLVRNQKAADLSRFVNNL